LTVNSGRLKPGVELAQELDITTFDSSELSLSSQDPDTQRVTEVVTGVAVNASASQHIENIGANVSGGKDALGLVEGANVIGGSTQAYVLDAQINDQNIGADARQDVAIKASNIAYVNSFVGAVSAGGSAGGAVLDIHGVSRATSASAVGGSIAALGHFGVDALTRQGVSSIAVGGSVGSQGAGAGTLSLVLFSNRTEALVDATHVSAAALDIKADNRNDIYTLAGAVAVGGNAGGGAISVGISDSTTTATLRNTHGDNRVDVVSGDVHVDAANATDIHHIVVSGAGGGGNGIAGMADVNLVTDRTGATIENAQIGTATAKAGDVRAQATHTLDIDSKAGALGVGVSGGGVGAGASVNIVKARTTSTVTDSLIQASGLTAVDASSTKHIDATALTAGVGGSVGIGGAAVVILVGDDIKDDSASELDKGGAGTLSNVDAFSGGDKFAVLSNTVGTGVVADADKAALNAATARSTTAVTGSAGGYQFRTAAVVNGSNTIDTGSLAVTATDKTDTKTLVGGFGASIGGGVGGAVAFTTVKANVAANVSGTALTTGGNVKIAAVADNDAGKTIDVLALAGAIGGVGLGAAVSYADIANHVDANLSSGVDAGTGIVTVTARDDTDIESDAKGAAAGAYAAGIVVSVADKSSTVNAFAGGDITAGAATVSASGQGMISASGQSAAAGLTGAGSGAVANAIDKTTAKAGSTAGATFDLGAGTLEIRASATPRTEARADGVSLSAGLAAGASAAAALADTTIDASLGANTTVNAGGLTLTARQLRSGDDASARSKAFAGSGGVLSAGSATVSDADATVNAKSKVGSGSTLNLGNGTATIAASVDSKQVSSASGITVGGLVAAGFNESNATSDNTSDASLGSNVKVRAGTLDIKAGGTDDNLAVSKSGSGGLFSGAASIASTSTKSLTKVEVDNGSAGRDIAVENFLLTADHTSTFNSGVNSTNASAIGASAAYAHNKVDKSVVSVKIGEGVKVDATRIDVLAANRVAKPKGAGFNVLSGSGGLFDAAAAHSDTTVNTDTDVAIGAKTSLTAAAVGPAQGAMTFTALNDVQLYDAVKMDAGGAIALAKAESFIYNDQNDADIKVGSGTGLISDGTITLESKTAATADTEVQAKTYGASGAAQGRTISRIGTSNNVAINGARLESDEDVVLRAGFDNELDADAETRLWNRTALPVETDPDADAKITQDNRITVKAYQPTLGTTPTGDGAEDQIARAAIATVKDIRLEAGDGKHTTRGYGRGTDLYRELIANAAKLFGSNISLDITGGSTSDKSLSGVVVDGTVFAGTHFHQFLSIDANGEITRQSEGVATPGFRANVALDRNIQDRIDALQALVDEYKDDPRNSDIVGGFESDIQVLQAKSARLGVGAKANFRDIQPMAAYTGNVIATGDSLSGSGELFAPGDARIEIINGSTDFLNIVLGPELPPASATATPTILPSLYIPDDLNGTVLLNGVRVSTQAEIDAINQHGVGSGFTAGRILDRQTSVDPVILVRNTYEDPIDLDALNPEIHVDGDISNLRGLVKVDSTGTIQIASKVYGKTVDIKTKGDFMQLFTVGFTHTGGASPTENVPNVNDPYGTVVRTIRNRFTGALEEDKTVPYTLDYFWEDQAKDDYPNTERLEDRNFGEYTFKVATPASEVRQSYSDSVAFAQSSTIAGNNVFISGEKLNINSLIQSGLPTFDLSISQAKANLAVSANGDWVELGMRENGQPVDSLFQPKIRWVDNQIELQSLGVGGGYMQLYGDIFSTGNGMLKVLDGYGRIDVTNNSSYNLAVNQLDTGPGVAGMIKITDTSTKYLGNPLITTISRVGGNVSASYENRNPGLAGQPLVSSQGVRMAQYDPLANRRLHWLNAETYAISEYVIYDQACFATCSLGDIGDLLASDDEPIDKGPYVKTAFNPRPVGEWLAVDPLGRTDDYILDFTRYRTSTSDSGRYKLPNKDGSSLDGEYYSGANQHIRSRQDWTWTEYNYYDHSLYASVPIQIEFTGYDTGRLTVDAGAHDLALNGALRNLTGATSLAGNSIRSADVAVVSAGNLQLTARTGSIGTASTETGDSAYLRTNLHPGATLDATAAGGIAVREIDGKLAILRASGGGIVNLVAEGDLVNAATGVAVTGSSIRLTSENGSIGADTPMLVDTTSATGNLGAVAARAITLTEDAGDMRLQSVASRSGADDVLLRVVDGSIIDDNSVARVDVETRDALLAVAQRAGLQGADAAASEENTVKGYNLARQQDYLRYWQMRHVRADGSGGFGADAYDPAYAYRLNAFDLAALKADQGWTDLQVRQFEARQTAQYHQGQQAFGALAFDSQYRYDVQLQDGATYQQLIAGSTWSDAQITNRVAAGIFKDIADTEVLIEDANVAGRNITLLADNGGIGIEQAARVISFIDPDAWTEPERLALAAADRKDVSIDYANRAITVRQKNDIDITLLNEGRLIASAGSDIYIGSEADVRILRIDAPSDKEVRVKTGAGLINVAGSGAAVLRGHDITLEAGGASLGTDAMPFLLDMAGGLTARARGDLFVNNTSGDMRVEQVYATNLAKLTSVGAIVEDPLNHNLITDIRARQLWLTAATTIGQADATGLNYLDIGSDPLGWADMSAPGGIFVYSPSRQVNLRNIDAASGPVHMTSFASSIGITGLVGAMGNVVLGAGEALLFDPDGRIASSDGDVVLTSSGYRLAPVTDPFALVDPTRYGLQMDGASMVQALAGSVTMMTAYDMRFAGGSMAAAGDILLAAGRSGAGSVRIDPAEGGGNAIYTPQSVEVVAADNIIVGGDVQGDASVRFSARNVNFSGGIVRTNGLLDVASDVDLTIGGALFGGAGIALRTTSDVLFSGGSVTSNGPVTIVAGSDGTGSIYGSPAGGVDIVSLGPLTLQAPDAIGAGSPLVAQVAGSVTFLGAMVNAQVASTPLSHPLAVSVSGIGGAPAANVQLDVASDAGVLFNVFNVGIAAVTAVTPSLKVPDGMVTNYASFALPAYSTRIDAASRVAQPGYDVHAFTVGGGFSFDALPDQVAVGAFLLQKNPDLRVAGDPPGNVVDTVAAALQQPATGAAGVDRAPGIGFAARFGFGAGTSLADRQLVTLDANLLGGLASLDDKEMEKENE
jgi:hypothetical protein